MTIDYGYDTWRDTDGIRTGRVATGVDLVTQAAFWRLNTKRGQLLSDPDYGVRLSDYLGAESTPAEWARLPGVIKSELSKDDRIADGSLAVSMEPPAAGGGVSAALIITIRGLLSSNTPFRLVLGVDETTVALLEAGGI